MTGLVRKVTLFGACALMAASTAPAQPVPEISPTNSKWLDWKHPRPTDPGSSLANPQYIDVVTENRPTIDPFNSQMTLRLRDLADNPISGALVEFDFGASLGGACDFRLCGVEGAGMTLAGNVVRGVTDALGDITFRLAGGADGNAFLPTDPLTSTGATVVVRVNSNVLMDVVPVAADQNVVVSPGTTTSDISFLVAGLGRSYYSRADLDHSGPPTINAVDISFLLPRIGRINNCTLNEAPVCP